VSALKATRNAERQLRTALNLAIEMQGRWEQEHTELLAEDVRRCRAVVEAMEHLLAGNGAPAEALLVVQEAQRQIERERLQEAIRETAHRHGWRAP
jgi:hypothetical protein